MIFSRRTMPHSPGWMITLADLLSLLVSFFALLYATTATDPATWNRVVKPISTYLTGQPDAPAPSVSSPVLPGDTPKNYAASLLSRLAESDPSFAGARVAVDEQNIRVIMPSRPGFADWLDGTPPPLAGLAHTLDSLNLPVDVIVYRQGELDETAADLISGALRDADKVADHLKDSGFSQPIHAIGMIEAGTAGRTRLEFSIPTIAPADNPAGGRVAP